jgi:NAD(P)-dependent dehydrogenase (short-subunit alcohol dehydrogenase family)
MTTIRTAAHPRLHDRVCLITGASRGIGAAIARRFAAEGAHVIITDINAQRLGVLAGELADAATQYTLDVRSESDWSRVLDRVVRTHHRLDVLVNNAGISGFDPEFVPPLGPEPGPHDPEHVTLAAWRAVHETNLDGVFLGCKHGIRVMKPASLGGADKSRGGSIINISSRSGQVGIPAAAAYASSKAAVRNHTKSVALYCARQNYAIRCNSIHPAAILTSMWDPLLGDGVARDQAIDDIGAGIPLGRMGTPDEVAAMAAFLASDDSIYVTGSEFIIDGGILAGAEAEARSSRRQ